MEHVEFVYTHWMTEDEVEAALRERRTGVLSLADEGRAYAVPVDHHYDGERLLVRLGAAPDSTKMAFLEGTTEACFVTYADRPDAFSVLVRGPLRRLDDVDDATVNEWFGPFRLFGEGVSEVDVRVYELVMESVTGRAS
jgi:hypothetical protein